MISSITPFISKTHDLIENASKELIEWTADGTGFVVKEPKRLEKEVLHKYFKHNNFSSFARQLDSENQPNSLKRTLRSLAQDVANIVTSTLFEVVWI